MSYAAELGDEVMVGLLLARNDVDVNLKDSYNRLPLLHATEKCPGAVVDRLLAQNAG